MIFDPRSSVGGLNAGGVVQLGVVNSHTYRVLKNFRKKLKISTREKFKNPIINLALGRYIFYTTNFSLIGKSGLKMVVFLWYPCEG